MYKTILSNQGWKSNAFLCKNSRIDSLSSLLISITSLFLLYKKPYPSENAEVFDSEIQPHEMIKSLCQSVVVL